MGSALAGTWHLYWQRCLLCVFGLLMPPFITFVSLAICLHLFIATCVYPFMYNNQLSILLLRLVTLVIGWYRFDSIVRLCDYPKQEYIWVLPGYFNVSYFSDFSPLSFVLWCPLWDAFLVLFFVIGSTRHVGDNGDGNDDSQTHWMTRTWPRALLAALRWHQPSTAHGNWCPSLRWFSSWGHPLSLKNCLACEKVI